MKRLFEENSICRLCLRVDENAYKIDNTNHKAFIESIIKLKIIHYILPDNLYVCYICNTFLLKCFNFAQTLWKTQEIISVLLKTTDLITKPLLDGIDRHNNGLNPITLSSVVISGNNFNYDGHTSAVEVNIEEVNLDDLVEKLKKETKNQECKIKRRISETENHLHSNSSCDEKEETVTCNLEEEEVEIGNIDIETSGIFADSLIKDACHKPKPKKLITQDIKEKIRKTSKRLKPIKAKNASSIANEKKRKKKSDGIDEDFRPDSTGDSEDSEYDSYDDKGKPIRTPKDERVYPMQCDHCDFVLPEKRDHYRHYQYCHPDVEYPYKRETSATCSVCGKLVAPYHIRRHEASHYKQDFKCTFCPKVFPNKIRWYKHVRNVHPKKKFKCDYCSKEFKTKSDFRRHIRTHTGSKPFKCHICGEAFAHSGNRIIHIRVKHQNFKYKPKDHEKTQTKRRKNTRYDKEVYDTSDNEPVVQNGIEEAEAKS
ncbi:hypothetical protein PYW07_014353 [Mythimna separata]|uniref:C2H2-type domain-containing protein n=1 Tax=Mythimna separata TaxID=271217 RepID=A0AAD7YY68_MYTSE|nr:hypothetical protein PYW07_014353 [Mythimna separata]